MKKYIGHRFTGQNDAREEVTIRCDVSVECGGRRRDLRPRLDLRNHSPCGFEWGYGGSGPSQLALALCADALGDSARACRVYQFCKERVVCGLAAAGWVLPAVEVVEAVERIEAEEPFARPPT